MKKTIRLAADQPFKFDSFTDGPDCRTVVFLQGCPIRCAGCQNPHLWNAEGGTRWMTGTTAKVIVDAGNPYISISGGEPLAQADALIELLLQLRHADWGDAIPHIILYTGYVYEDAIDMSWAIPAIRHAFALADIVVDGPYIEAADDDQLQWRGSRNQRPIMIRAMRTATDGAGTQAGNAWKEEPIVNTSWDEVTFSITPGGDVIGAAGAMEGLLGGGDTIARCGKNDQTRRPEHLTLSLEASVRIKATIVVEREKKKRAIN